MRWACTTWNRLARRAARLTRAAACVQIVPVHTENGEQVLRQVDKSADGTSHTMRDLMAVRFVPLVAAEGRM